jgi:branched-chain amino acid transport system substrate-binding protein
MKTRLSGIFLLAVLVVPSLALGQVVRGVTDSEVTIGISIAMSGPVASFGALGQGAKAWADYVNEKGGIHGRKIKVLMKDDAMNPTRALANLQEMKDSVLAVNLLMGVASNNVAKSFFLENKIPLIMPFSAVSVWKNMPREQTRYTFTTYPDYEDGGSFMAEYAAKELGTKKIAVFYQNDDWGKGNLKGIERAIQGLSGKAVLAEAVSYEFAERALSNHAFKLKQSAADAVLLGSHPMHSAILLKEMAKIDYRPKVVGQFGLSDPVMFKLAGELFEGTYVTTEVEIPGSSAEADKVLEKLIKYEPQLAESEKFAVTGALCMMHLVQGLKNAGRNLSVETLIQGMETIRDWVPEGAGPAVTYGPERHHGGNALRMAQAKNGRIVPLTNWTYFKTYF